MTDIQSKRLLVAKGLMFLLIAAIAGGYILLLAPRWEIALLLLVFAWSAARFYYFLFYVLHTYVDPRDKYPGIIGLLKSIQHRTERD